MEPPKGRVASRQEKIKDILGDLGIAGETVSPSAARTIEELAYLGIVKGYSTIVAVGSEALTNKVITAIVGRKDAKDVVLGVIPDDFLSKLAKLTGVTDLYSACQALKFRRLKTVDVCLVEPNKYFITEAIIETFRNHSLYFSIEKLKGKALTNRVVIEPGLKVAVYDKTFIGKTPSRFFNWLFGRKEKDIYTSFFYPKKIRLEAEGSLSLKVSGETISKTPVTLHNRSRILKIIVARDIIREKKSS